MTCIGPICLDYVTLSLRGIENDHYSLSLMRESFEESMSHKCEVRKRRHKKLPAFELNVGPPKNNYAKPSLTFVVASQQCVEQ